MNIATLIVDLQLDFFASHPRLVRNRAVLASNVNALVADARQSGSHIFWIKQVFAPDMRDAPKTFNGAAIESPLKARPASSCYPS